MTDRQGAYALLRDLNSLGYRIRVEGELLKVLPSTLSSELKSRIAAHRSELFHLVQVEQRKKSPPSGLDAFRGYMPSFWKVVRLTDGREGLVTGISSRGLMVSFGYAAPTCSIDLDQVVEVVA